MTTLPDLQREASILAASWGLALSITAEDIGALWAQAREAFDADTLASLHRATPRELALEVCIGADDDGSRILSLWLGQACIARLRR